MLNLNRTKKGSESEVESICPLCCLSVCNRWDFISKKNKLSYNGKNVQISIILINQNSYFVKNN